MSQIKLGAARYFRPTLTQEVALTELMNSGNWESWQHLLRFIVEHFFKTYTRADASRGSKALLKLHDLMVRRQEIQAVIDEAARMYELGQDPEILIGVAAVIADFKDLQLELPEVFRVGV